MKGVDHAAVGSGEIFALIDELQLRYASALDEKDLSAWLDTFCPDDTASYTCTSLENVRSGFPVGLMLDDCRARLNDRVTFIRKVWAGTFQDYQTRHLVQRIRCSRRDSGTYEVRSNFCITYTEEDGFESRILASGVYEDEVRLVGERALFLSKKVVTDNSAMPRYIVYPL